MTINKKDLLTLDDGNEYVVVSKVSYKNREYYYIVNINDNSSIKFCYLDRDQLVELNDGALVKELLPLLKNNL